MNRARWDLCGGRSAMGVPTAIARRSGEGFALAVNNAFALPTALTAIFRIYSPTPSSRSSEQPLLRFYRGDFYSDAGGPSPSTQCH